MNTRTAVILLGKPASGKSTLARSLMTSNSNWLHFGARLFFAKEIENNSSLGLRAKGYADRKEWIPDFLLFEGLQHATYGRDPQCFLLEGLPASSSQAETLTTWLNSELSIDLLRRRFLYIDASDDVCKARASRRVVCKRCTVGVEPAVRDSKLPERCANCGQLLATRGDDEKMAFESRLEKHKTHRDGVLKSLNSESVIFIDGELSQDKVLSEVNSTLLSLGR